MAAFHPKHKIVLIKDRVLYLEKKKKKKSPRQMSTEQKAECQSD